MLDDRNTVHITGATDVISFDENTVILLTNVGELVIKGGNIHISKIDVTAGNLSLEGIIDDISYSEGQPAGGFLGRLFR